MRPFWMAAAGVDDGSFEEDIEVHNGSYETHGSHESYVRGLNAGGRSARGSDYASDITLPMLVSKISFSSLSALPSNFARASAVVVSPSSRVFVYVR